MSQPASRRAPLDIPSVIQMVEACAERAHDVPVRRDAQMPLVAVQPHSDDLALSATATVQRWIGRLDIVTAFAQGDLTVVRQREDRLFGERFDCGVRFLSLNGSPRATAERSAASCANLEGALAATALETVPCIGPLGVGSHPDHVSVTETVRARGARGYWEDVAFWGIYGSSVEDRYQFAAGAHHPSNLVIVVTELSVEAKVAALKLYPSQSTDVWRPIRYAAAVGHEHGLNGFYERLFVERQHLDWYATGIRARLELLPPFDYGGRRFEAYAAPLGAA